jgi:hypothetical protein
MKVCPVKIMLTFAADTSLSPSFRLAAAAAAAPYCRPRIGSLPAPMAPSLLDADGRTIEGTATPVGITTINILPIQCQPDEAAEAVKRSRQITAVRTVPPRPKTVMLLL